MPELPPLGICRCGCGEPTAIAKKTNQRRKAGEHSLFVKGHYGGRIVHPTSSAAAPPPVVSRSAQSLAAVELYRETLAERRPILAERQAKALAAAKKSCDDAEARLHELRHRGRPRTVNRPPPLSLRKHSDEVLLATLPQWQGER